MGDYEIRARLTGSHSPDPAHRGPGEAVHEFEQWLRKMAGHGHTVHSAEVTHWPGSDQEHAQDLHGGEAEPAGDLAAPEPAGGATAAAGDGPAGGAPIQAGG
jgi:hypothetical protein